MKISIFGAELGNRNMGVSALAVSIIEGIFRLEPEADIVLHDFRSGIDREAKHFFNGKEYSLIKNGINCSKNFIKFQSIHNLSFFSASFPKLNPVLKHIVESDLALSITGGDSFTDLYGQQVFNAGIFRKELVLKHDVPLVLLPQTYGPFENEKNREIAKETILKASEVWARDHDSFERLKQLLGDSFNPEIHKEGVDVAFALCPSKPKEDIAKKLTRFIEKSKGPTIGINISGLIYNDSGSKERYKHIVSYKELIKKVIGKFLSEGVDIVLVSHVMEPTGHESDFNACVDIFNKFKSQYQDQLFVLSNSLDQSEVKWAISQLDWFCGTRMHATIASLSTLVPTATIAYSLKAKGVFRYCGQEESVADLRADVEEKILNILFDSFNDREKNKEVLKEKMPTIIEKAKSQFSGILKYAKI